MGVWNDTHACIVAVILLLTVLVLTEAIATLNYTETSGCPGDRLVFTCLASDTDILRWKVNTGEIGFRSNNNLFDERPLTIDGTSIVANLTDKNCSNNNIFCSLESLILIPIWSNMGNLTLSCQSNENESERIVITTKDGDQCIGMTTVTVAPTTHTTGPEQSNSGFLVRASFITSLLTSMYTLTIII